MKHLLFIATLLLAASQVTAGNVDINTAKASAMRYLKSANLQGRHAAPATVADVQLVRAEMSKANSSHVLYYVFNTRDSYVIVSGDDRARQILAHGDQPIDMNNIPCNMQVWLESYRQQIEYLHAHPDFVVNDEGPRHASAYGNESVAPLLTALWDQGDPYNRECPKWNSVPCYTGCGATSLSMIFYYWKYPTELTSAVPGYTTETNHITLGSLPSTTFDWDNMIDNYRYGFSTEQANAVAHLLRHVGQSERMDYTTEGSGTGTYNILQTVMRFGYDQDAQVVSKEGWWGSVNYDDEQWGAIIQEELLEGRPILMCAYTPTWSGHAFNIDGYDADDDTYHINWGWSGSGNAYYALNAFQGGGEMFNVGQQLIIGIEPPATVPTIKTRGARVNVTTYVDSTETARFLVKGALLTSGINVTLNDDNNVFTIDTESISMSEQQNGKYVNVTYSPKAVGDHTATITLSSEGAEDKIVTLKGTCILETYDPVMLNASNINETSLSIQWQDVTPEHNVASYQLEIADVPFHELRMQETFDNNEYSGTSTSDWSSRLDEITSTPGWTGSKVYRSNSDLILGTSKSKGWIQTPSLDMYGNNGVITVKVTAKCIGSDTESPLKVICGENETTITVAADSAEYVVMLPCSARGDTKVKLSSATGKRVVLMGVKALAGDDYSPIDLTHATYLEGITGTNYVMNNMAPGYYGLRVRTLYTDGTLSPWSNRTRVLIDWKNGDVNRDGEINIADANTIIDNMFMYADSPYALVNNDVNGDGEISISDINTIIDMILSGE